MKTCVWCMDQEPKAAFQHEAHIFPDSLGGKAICPHVCDECNSYFGAKQSGLPSVEIAFKEPLAISRHYILSQLRHPGLKRFKGEYFEYDTKTHIINTKHKYRLLKSFQTNFVKQFKRGVYNVFLEPRSVDCSDAFDSKFNIIRAFARYGFGDCPCILTKARFTISSGRHLIARTQLIFFGMRIKQGSTCE